MSKKQSGSLLSGLVSGINQTTRVTPDDLPTRKVRMNELRPRPNQPRRYFDEAALLALAESIRANGLLQPLLVRSSPQGGYEVIAGERRLRAAHHANLDAVPVHVLECDDEDADRLSLVENLVREDLDRYEDVAFKLRLIAREWRMDEVSAKGVLRRLRRTPDEDPQKVAQLEELFARIGREQWPSFVANGLPVLDLPARMLEQVQRGALQYTKALIIARAPEAAWDELLAYALGPEQPTQAMLRERAARVSSGADRADRDLKLTKLRKNLTPRALDRLPPRRRERAQALLDELTALFEG